MTIPTTIRVPFVFVEFDPSKAFQGPSILNYQVLVIGQRTTTGSKSEKQIDLVTSADEAAAFYGNGSMMHRIFMAYFDNTKVVPVYGASLDDDGSGVPATGTFTISGTATADGTIVLYIAGKRITVVVLDTEAATAIGDNAVIEINAITDLPVTAANSTGTVTLTAKNDGEAGNDIDMRINYNDGEVLPAGVSIAVVAMASGATNPDIQDIIDIWGDEWYQVIICPFNDATNLTAMETELADRFTYSRMIDGLYVTGKKETLANLTTFGNGRNSQHVCCPYLQLVPTYIGDWVGAWGAQIAVEGQADPARPFQTLELKGILPPAITERFTLLENNQLLTDGIATFYVDSGGKVRIQRAITMYQTNPQSAPDIAYLDVNTLLNLMYLRFDFRNAILTKYARSKLADDGTNFGTNQPIITPSIGKAEAIAKFRQWEALGLVENVDQFKNDLIVERNASDPNRLDWFMTPDLINQFRVGGATIQFLLQNV